MTDNGVPPPADAHPATASRGGIIVSGPLKGIAFGPGGTPYNFVYGDLVSANVETDESGCPIQSLRDTRDFAQLLLAHALDHARDLE